ncbi:DUF2283 domain-containing protein [Thermoflexus sp.]|uniref:DUF2283 domain-containing protein n=1 Tax=Thermoflexus sp. TaxID=1969742 RepID=UPI00345DBDB3
MRTSITFWRSFLEPSPGCGRCRPLKHERPYDLTENEKRDMVTRDIEIYLELLPYIQGSPQQTIWLSYDREADVLYVSLGNPIPATDSELTDEDIIIRYHGDRVIGYTILHASRRSLFRSSEKEAK